LCSGDNGPGIGFIIGLAVGLAVVVVVVIIIIVVVVVVVVLKPRRSRSPRFRITLLFSISLNFLLFNKLNTNFQSQCFIIMQPDATQCDHTYSM